MAQEALKEIIKKTQELISKRLNELIPVDKETLTNAIRYSLLGTGKRLRPLLIMETAKIFTKVHNRPNPHRTYINLIGKSFLEVTKAEYSAKFQILLQNPSFFNLFDLRQRISIRLLIKNLNKTRLFCIICFLQKSSVGNRSDEDLITVASAIEMIHVFSLIHDDLPAMDNDDYRRGEPTCHKKFTEYDAILAGDSLIPLASEIIITKTNSLTYEEKCKIILAISKAIGYKGMCLGQSLDIEFEKSKKSKSALEAETINTYKTGYLFKSCIEIGCILGKASKKDTEDLINYSLSFGKAFQLMDDLEDNEIQSSDIQKTKDKIVQLVNNCLEILDRLKGKNEDAIETLRLIAKFCLKNN